MAYSPTSSPKYLEIVKAVDEYKEKVLKEEVTRHYLLNEVVRKIDPNIDTSRFYSWITSRFKEKGSDTVKKLIESHFLVEYPNMSREEKVEALEGLQTEIRHFAKKLFHAKIYEFIDNPDTLKAMTFPQAMKLYQIIRAEEDREKELDLKRRDSRRRDIFGLFTIMSLSKQFTPDDIQKFRELTKSRMNERPQLQQNSESDIEGSAKGQGGGISEPERSPDMGIL